MAIEMNNHNNNLWIPMILKNQYDEPISHRHIRFSAIPLVALKYSEIPIKLIYLPYYYPNYLLLEMYNKYNGIE